MKKGRERDVVVLHRTIAYGGNNPWLRPPGRPVEAMLRDAEFRDGVVRLSTVDELVDTVLHCLLDLGSFPGEARVRITTCLEELRAVPVAAGHAAERIQSQFAPALPWDALLAAVVEKHWDDLERRRGALTRQIAWADPFGSLRRKLGGRFKRRSSEPGHGAGPPGSGGHGTGSSGGGGASGSSRRYGPSSARVGLTPGDARHDERVGDHGSPNVVVDLVEVEALTRAPPRARGDTAAGDHAGSGRMSRKGTRASGLLFCPRVVERVPG
jgi:hypothetical protein